jgi:hypothetical protein
VRQGLKLKELQQLHKHKVIEAIPLSSLTKEQKKKALQYLMFLKKKSCRRIKGRGCADGWKQ